MESRMREIASTVRRRRSEWLFYPYIYFRPNILLVILDQLRRIAKNIQLVNINWSFSPVIESEENFVIPYFVKRLSICQNDGEQQAGCQEGICRHSELLQAPGDFQRRIHKRFYFLSRLLSFSATERDVNLIFEHPNRWMRAWDAISALASVSNTTTERINASPPRPLAYRGQIK